MDYRLTLSKEHVARMLHRDVSYLVPESGGILNVAPDQVAWETTPRPTRETVRDTMVREFLIRDIPLAEMTDAEKRMVGARLDPLMDTWRAGITYLNGVRVGDNRFFITWVP